MSDTAHQEKHFESYIVSKLEAQGWKVGETTKYDTERALYAEDLIAWLEASGQGEKWAKLKKDNGDRALDTLMDRLTKALETHGAVQVLRQGFSIAGCGHLASLAAPGRWICLAAQIAAQKGPTPHGAGQQHWPGGCGPVHHRQSWVLAVAAGCCSQTGADPAVGARRLPPR